MSEYFDEYRNALKKYADFEGRATVREFWSFYLINSAVGPPQLIGVPADRCRGTGEFFSDCHDLTPPLARSTSPVIQSDSGRHNK